MATNITKGGTTNHYVPLDRRTSAPFPKIKPESDQASRYNYQFTGNTNREKQHVNYTTGMQSEKSSLWETAEQIAHFLPTNKLQSEKKEKWWEKV